MASRLIKEKEQVKLQDKYMEVDKETGKLVLTDKVNTALLPNLNNIVDSQGRNRFVEGNLIVDPVEGVTPTYDKWSLSGTHLMIVCAFNVEADTTIPDNKRLFAVRLPNWIKNKIKYLNGNYIDFKTVIGFDTSFAEKTMRIRVLDDDEIVYVNVRGSVSFTTDTIYRIELDFLIDSD